jgi:D-tyrosyl-tRNA(Tyr) deacylase
MRLFVQRVSKCELYIDNSLYSSIDTGFLVYVGFKIGDTKATSLELINKLVNLRVFSDESNKLNRNLTQVNGSILFVSSFTLYGNPLESNRPSFTNCLDYNSSNEIYLYMCEELKKRVNLKTGVFGSDMKVISTNDGPVNILYEK